MVFVDNDDTAFGDSSVDIELMHKSIPLQTNSKQGKHVDRTRVAIQR